MDFTKLMYLVACMWMDETYSLVKVDGVFAGYHVGDGGAAGAGFGGFGGGFGFRHCWEGSC